MNIFTVFTLFKRFGRLYNFNGFLLFSSVLGFLLMSFNYSYSQTIHYGDSIAIGNGMIKTWVETDPQNVPLRIGVTLTNGALINLPPGAVNNSLNFPAAASDSLFKHAFVNWNPHGHPPAGIYTPPHFDIHFYMITPQIRGLIAGGPDVIPIDPQFIPQDYIFIPGDGNYSIPQMGVHMVDSLAPEMNGEDFTETLIYGFSKGNMIFVEPMITKDYLLSMPQDVLLIKQPAAYQKTGYYPTVYRITPNSTTGDIDVELTDLQLQNGISSVQEDSFNPEVFELSQNYPNPFNPSTTIKYRIIERSFVSLVVTDILGREVASLINEEQPAGNYEIKYDAGNLSSGVYFYKLQAGSFTEIKKMMLLR